MEAGELDMKEDERVWHSKSGQLRDQNHLIDQIT